MMSHGWVQVLAQDAADRQGEAWTNLALTVLTVAFVIWGIKKLIRGDRRK